MTKKRILLLAFSIAILFSLLAVVLASQGIIATDLLSLYFGAGTYYFNQGDYKQAVYYFTKAIEQNPEAIEAYHNLGVSYFNLGDTDKAVSALQQAVNLDDNYAKGHYSLGLVYYHAHDYAHAITHFTKVTELQPDNAQAFYDTAIALVDLFRAKEASGQTAGTNLDLLEKAYSLFLKADELQPGFPHALSNAAVVYDILGEYHSDIANS